MTRAEAEKLIVGSKMKNDEWPKMLGVSSIGVPGRVYLSDFAYFLKVSMIVDK